MREHQTRYPIVVHVLSGHVDFGVGGVTYPLQPGDLITLGSNVPHDLHATSECIVRLTLSKRSGKKTV